ncbi:MAG: HEPN domain-containing protein [Desulfurococcaceae archaeon TW002]
MFLVCLLEGWDEVLLYHVNEAPCRYFNSRGENSQQDLVSCTRELDRHYIPSRYPNAHPSETPHEAYDEEVSRRALSAAEVLHFVREVLRV